MTMTMKRSLAAVAGLLAELTETVRELAVAVDDCPAADGDLAVIEAMRGHAADSEGDVRETAAAVAAALEAEESGDAPRAARLAADAHERFSAFTRRVRFGLSGHDSLFEVDRLPERRGAGWRSWSDVVLRQLEQIDHAIHRTDAAFVACWQEVVDRGASVSVTATQIAVESRSQQRHPSPA
jgi:hypothetical protein